MRVDITMVILVSNLSSTRHPQPNTTTIMKRKTRAKPSMERTTLSTPLRQTPPSGCAGLSSISPRTLSMTPQASRWRPANVAAVSSSACAFRRRNSARSLVAAGVSPEPCARLS